MTISIILADDHGIVRTGIRLLLDSQPDFKVIGEASNGHEALHKVRELHPTLAVLDIAMPELNGIETARQISSEVPNTRIVILSMFASSEYIYQSLQAGAKGYVLKESASEELIEAIYTVYNGKRHLSHKIADGLIDDYLIQRTNHQTESPLQQLSVREREVLQLVAEGKSSAAIGAIIALSPKTVETYRSRMMQKLGLADLPSLIKFAIQYKLISL